MSKDLHPILVVCETCGKVLARFPSLVHKRNFCSKDCYSIAKNGSGNPHWKNGRRVKSQGYIRIYKPDHIRADKEGCVLEHILVMEERLRRSIQKGEIVHHINGTKSDNRPENLIVYPSISEHYRLGHPNKKRNGKGQFVSGLNAGESI